MNCPKCESDNISKDGHRVLAGSKVRQKYKCKDCGQGFSEREISTVEEYRSSVKVNGDRSIYSDRLIEIFEEDVKNPDALLKAHGFDPEQWDLVSATSNMWHAMRPEDRGRLVQYQSKILAKPKGVGELTVEAVDEFFSTFKSPNLSARRVDPKPNGKQVLEICLADLHIGKIDIAGAEVDSVTRCKDTIRDIASRITPKIGKICLVLLGDTFHYDGNDKATTGGTAVDGASNMATVFDTGASLLIWCVDVLLDYAPVELIGIYGNHDRAASYMLFKSLEFYYKDSPDVTVDAGHLSRKFRKFGNNLVLWNHGDMSKNNAYSLIQREARQAFGETKFAEIHSGHFHSQKVEEKDGVIIRYLPTTSPTDTWHYENGYTGSLLSTMSFVWDEILGLREIWYTNLG